MNVLDLYAGYGERRRKDIESMGHKYTTLDINPKFNCDTTMDVMKITQLDDYDFIWASPPCQAFSVAKIGYHWNIDNTPKSKDAEQSILLVEHTIKLLKKSSKKWIIENPRGKLRKLSIMDGIDRDTVTYCQYGDSKMKPTDIWHNGINWNPRPMCKNGDPCHTSAPRGSRTGSQEYMSAAERSVVPLELWIEILKSAEES
jgi:hypothetical protein